MHLPKMLDLSICLAMALGTFPMRCWQLSKRYLLLLLLGNITQDDAKRKYIELINSLVKDDAPAAPVPEVRRLFISLSSALPGFHQ